MARPPVIRLALRTLLWGTMLGAAFPGPQVRAQQRPLVERLDENWRWRELAGPDMGLPFLRCVRPWRDGTFILADDAGLGVYDGWRLSREPGWSQPGMFAVDTIFALDEQHVVVGMQNEVRVIESDDPEATPVATVVESPRDLTSVVRWMDGRLVVGLRGVLQEVTRNGLVPMRDGPPGGGALISLVVAADGSAYGMAERGFYRLDGDRWIPLDLPRNYPGMDPWHPRVLSTGDATVILPLSLEAHDSGWILRDGRLEALPDPGSRIHVSDAILVEGRVLVATTHPPLRLLDEEPGRHDSTWESIVPPFRLIENIESLAVSGDHLAIVTDSGDLRSCNLASRSWVSFPTAPAGLGSLINAIAPASDGGLWIAADEGLGRFDGTAFRDVRRIAGETGQRLEALTTVAEDAEGAVWVGSGSAFEDALRWRNGQWTRVALDPGGPSRVHRICHIGDDLYFLLIASAFEPWDAGNVVRWHEGDAEPFGQTADGTTLPRCYDLIETRDGRMLLGTLNDIYERTDGAWRPIGLPANAKGPYFRLYEATDGTLWVGRGLRSPGLLRCDGDGWKLLDQDDWARAAAADFCEPGDGRLYFASAHGLFVVNGLTCNELSGLLPTRSFWPMLPDGSGGMWIGASNMGLARYHPDDATPPRLTASQVRMTVDGLPEVVWRAADAWNETLPEQLSYRVWLDDQPLGFPKNTDDRFTRGNAIRRKSIGPGRHELRVAAVDALGNEASEPEAIEFTRPPPVWRSPSSIATATALMCVLVAVILVLRLHRREQRTIEAARADVAERLATLARRLLDAQEEERRNLAREMHDDLGQSLTAARMGIEGALRADDPERRHTALTRAGYSLASALERVRNISHGLRPLVLDDHGLEQAVRSLVDEVAMLDGAPAIDLEARFDGTHVPADVAGHVFRILQEALTNVLRHANAGFVSVALDTTPSEVALMVRDDGSGFDPVQLPTVRRFGLLGMRERAELLGGRFRMESKPGEGTRLSVSIPIEGQGTRPGPTRAVQRD